MNYNKESSELLNKIGKWKHLSDPDNELTILEAMVEYAYKKGIEIDDIIDILSTSHSFKSLIEQDLSSRGMIYMDGIRVKQHKLLDW